MKQVICENLKTILLLVVVVLLPSKATFAISENDKKEHKEEHVLEHEHNRFELEVSFNNAGNFEYTGSVYFLPLKKIQVSADQNFDHFASVLVQELPFRNSKWGTFIGAGATMGNHEHKIEITSSDTHLETEKQWSAIIQSGLAYSLSHHWSTGFTVSPGYNFSSKEIEIGATIDIVFGF